MRPKTHAELEDIVRAADDIARLTRDVTAHDLKTNSDIARLVERHLEILGEAIRRIKVQDFDTFQQLRMGAEFIGMRNILAHAYDSINYEIILETCIDEVPLVREDAARLLNDSLEDHA